MRSPELSAQQMVPYLIDMWKPGQFPIDKLVKTYDFTDVVDNRETGAAGTAATSRVACVSNAPDVARRRVVMFLATPVVVRARR